MTSNLAALQELVAKYEADETKFIKGNSSAGTRARATLMELKKLCDKSRKDIQESKNAEKAA